MKTILFVDDEPWLQESLRCALEGRGFECLWVTDMTSALELLAVREVAVVVTDIMMSAGKNFPEIDSRETGFHFIDRLRAEWPSTPIVCLSVIGDEAKLRPIRSFRIDYLRKGEVPLSTVIQTIERAAGTGGQKIWRY